MTTRLKLYNGALGQFLGERTLGSLTEDREPRRLLDQVWDGGAVRYCLEQGLWNFATRSVRVEYSPSVEPPFGYRRAFDKPPDFVRTAALCTDEFFRNPLFAYTDEAGFWFADDDVIYARFVSSDEDYGGDLSLWPESFAEYVKGYLALKALNRLTQSKTDRETLKKEVKRLLVEARSKDAMNEPTAFPPAGSWSRARRGGWDRRRGDVRQ